MTQPIEVRILKSEEAVRQEALKGVISLLVVGAMVGIQWWMVTPEPERMIRLRKLGVTRCTQRRWHFRQGLISFPRRCLCTWDGAPRDLQRAADRAERGMAQ
ncbi:MAG: hypothetical protein M0T72_11310 [Candidatus Dormibacteraeota bacterium]|nr:hypothetical protein [Candidatus Dormibacteraeota bacterium]